ncbi:type IV toxin-antitoxin system AbiEi family antitoxin domain-containing protein [Tersicoccus sp. Bi-70]|uniref:type IV toxin-antitoxin system AbiEi family antitoxin domain-containing protein n=1 Tax=Tersicoccus sp. Bi-70 TaxID=1897634 RepID=UPI0009765E21|nr:type IV toxin-antitoxin system AbiEi family antitoxin domain-containing protein [Tersicoccus sp. Bi-70]OMH36702.1 hypothetical protein BGP79_12940 [Tersicoccus sp. Bi-70]
MPILRAVPTSTELGLRSLSQLENSGYSANRVDRLVRSGVLVRVWRGYYLRASAWSAMPERERQLVRLFCAQGSTVAGPRVLCRASAALAHGVSPLRIDTAVHVLCPSARSTQLRHAGLRYHAADEDSPAVLLSSGLRATDAVRTFTDCARHLPHRDALVIADQLVADGLDLAPVHAWAISHPGWRGVARLRLVLERADPLAESAGETLTRIRFHEWAIPLPTGQFEIMTPVGLFRADFAWPGAMVIVEFDGKVKYFGDTPTADVLFQERQREKALVALGWTVIRTDWVEVNRRPEALRARLISALARSRRPA